MRGRSRAVSDDELDPSGIDFPLRDYLDFEITEGEGRAVARIEQLGAQHLHPHGAVHGGVLFTLLDTAMGAAVLSLFEEDGARCATTDLQIRYLKPVFEGSLAATAEVVNAGKRMITLSGEVRDGDDQLLAVGTAAFAVLSDGRG